MKRDIEILSQGSYDLLVCGGGIYGAWTAYDAALRGLRVAIVEQGDWADATSSASSKLIHGGLRYLESYDFKLVKKALKERQMYLDYAPHRVWPLRFGVPIYRDSRVGMLRMKAGLMLYDALAGWPGEELDHLAYDAHDFELRFPFLKHDGLRGGYTYGDAQTDDARLVLELIAGAQASGAVCVSRCKLIAYQNEHGLATSATVKDLLTGTEVKVHARQFVSTAGQWLSNSEIGKDWIRMSKGVHVVLPNNDCKEALLLTAPQDGRVFFIIPWYDMTLLGTTDDDYRGDVDRVQVCQADIDYLLAAANHYMTRTWSASDVVASYAGVRVMQRSDAEHPSQLSRDWELRSDVNGVHHSIGGKLTSARTDAAHIVDSICRNLGIKKACATFARPFPWSPVGDYAAWQTNLRKQGERLAVDERSIEWLMRRHGSCATDVLDSIVEDAALAERIVPELPLIWADLLWSARHETVIHLDDLIRRRMPLLILSRPNSERLNQIAMRVAQILNWDEARMLTELARCMP